VKLGPRRVQLSGHDSSLGHRCVTASKDPGYVDIPGATGAVYFAVATDNLGSAAQITASVHSGTAIVPVVVAGYRPPVAIL
jgi:hypothetical protein